MYYTLAVAGVVDEIALATSKDGIAWEPRGVVLKPGRDGDWDGLLVGRPSVLHEGDVFRMWYDGRKDLPPGAPAEGVPKSPTSSRSVGYATSKDGLRWTKHPGNPVLGGDAGGVDVERVGAGYVMVYESHEGTRAATSDDGISWKDRGLWVPRSGRRDRPARPRHADATGRGSGPPVDAVLRCGQGRSPGTATRSPRLSSRPIRSKGWLEEGCLVRDVLQR